MPRQALRILHFEQVAGWLNAFADHPTASGKTRYMRLQSPVRAACGKFAHSCSPARLIFYSVCVIVSLSGCPGFAAVWPTTMTQSSDQQGRRTQVTAACWHSASTARGTGAKADPRGSQKEGGQGCKANSELCEGQYMSQLGTESAVLSMDQQLQVSVWNIPLAGKLAKTNSNRH